MTNSQSPDRAALADELTSFFNFINEPPAYEDQRMVRDYRHSLAHLWMPLHDKIAAALRSPSPYSGADEDFKLTYIKRWRTIVKLPAKYADEIRDALAAALPRDAEREEKQRKKSGGLVGHQR